MGITSTDPLPKVLPDFKLLTKTVVLSQPIYSKCYSVSSSEPSTFVPQAVAAVLSSGPSEESWKVGVHPAEVGARPISIALATQGPLFPPMYAPHPEVT